MSTSLAFWKYEDGVYLDNQEVYEKAVAERMSVKGLKKLHVEEIMESIKAEFADWFWLDASNFEHETRGSVSIFMTPQTMQFDCYSLNGDDMNRIIDVMLKFDCPLYDPQIETRFDEVN